MKTRIAGTVLLIFWLTACIPTSKPLLPVAATLTMMSTFVPPTPTSFIPATPLPTLIPALQLPIFTPDAIQVKYWQEYQATLAKCVSTKFARSGGECTPSSSTSVLCEWDILGRSDGEIYVWAECNHGSSGKPFVIYLKNDGSIEKAVFGGYEGLNYNVKLFPANVREKMRFYSGDSLFSGRVRQMLDHILYREAHIEEPPLVVLSAIVVP